MTEKTRIENPLILALDTTQSALCLALNRGAEILTAVTDHSSLPHSQRLFPLLDELLKSQSLSIHEIDLLAVNTGPGSFTGLRVGLAAVKGVALTLGKSSIGVNTFDALALAAGVRGVIIAVLIQAAKEELYFGFRWIEADGSIRLIHDEDGVLRWEPLRAELLSRIAASEVVFIGNAVAAHWGKLSALSSRWSFVHAPDSLAPFICAAALRQWQAGELCAVEAYYLRLSEAEAKLKK